MQSTTSDLVFLSPAHRQRHLDKMASVQAKLRSLPDTNDAAPAVTAPAVSSQAGGTSTRKSKRYSIEIEPFDGLRGGGCHWAVISPCGFSGGSCAGHIFEAVAQAFGAARCQSRAKNFSVQVVA